MAAWRAARARRWSAGRTCRKCARRWNSSWLTRSRSFAWRGGGARTVSRLGIIAGGGDLPRAVAQSAHADGREVFVIALSGSAEGEWLADFPHEWGAVGAPGQAFKSLRREGVN